MIFHFYWSLPRILGGYGGIRIAYPSTKACLICIGDEGWKCATHDSCKRSKLRKVLLKNLRVLIYYYILLRKGLRFLESDSTLFFIEN